MNYVLVQKIHPPKSPFSKFMYQKFAERSTEKRSVLPRSLSSNNLSLFLFWRYYLISINLSVPFALKQMKIDISENSQRIAYSNDDNSATVLKSTIQGSHDR